MADLEDLNTISITDMSQDEAIEYLRQLRLARRTPAIKPKKSTAKKNKASQSKAAKKITKTDAQALLKLLGD